MNEFAEIVFGLVYPVGVDVDPAVAVLRDYLAQLNYKLDLFRISDHLRSLSLGIEFDESDPLGLSHALMDAGNKARMKAEASDILAIAALNHVFLNRSKDDNKNPMPRNNVVHIIRSFKRPEEVKLLRDIYRPGFFLIGIAADEKEQIEFLRSRKGLTETQARSLIARDRDESGIHGQRTRDTFYLADVFVQLARGEYKDQLKRFLDLVFGCPFRTPTREEHAMFSAYASAARSASLGRQVGAAVATHEGEVLSVGANEVPQAGGGPYWEGDKKDHRDHTKPKDSNQEHRSRIIGSIIEKLKSKLFFSSSVRTLFENAFKDETSEAEVGRRVNAALEKNKTALLESDEAAALIEASDLKEITEYGRSVHAEMDAILTCARLGISVKGRILFTTTFPCHNCTRHIIGAGICKVVYIEPYPKSKAKDLHDDSITFGLEDAEKTGRIPFVPFVGVGPRRYLDFFSLQLSAGYDIERKAKDGIPTDWSWDSHNGPRVAMLPYTYLEREAKVINERSQQLKKLLED
ncbi:MAG TPA: anti-phage dCTP deaminase [Candidatus Saccharimonadales bacterium]|jgi:deoxycytidylate deaminase|nr:anti-phage dCTP deaminase [Candidatus Saccharimonadales bacterium]